MANQFYVAPAGDMSQGLQGLGQILQQNAEKKAEQEALDQQQQAATEAQSALYDAYQSNDPAMLMEAAIKYPSITKQAEMALGMQQDYQKKEATDFATQVLADPARAAELAQKRISILQAQGRDPSHTIDFLETLEKDPGTALRGLEMNFAAANPESYKAYRSTIKDAQEMESKVVGDYLINPQTGEVIFDGSRTSEGAPEHGLTPLIFRDPNTGKYTAYLPNKAGGMTPIQTPEGQEFTPDSGRLGYNPNNILEQGAAQTQAERAAAAPANQRNLQLGQQKAAVVNNAIDQAIDQASGLTTGIAGKLTSSVAGTPAHDLANTIATLKANLAFDALQAMRDASPTGGALGSVSAPELALLESAVASLEQSQSKEQFIKNLETVRQYTNDIVNGKQQQYQNTYGGGQGLVAPRNDQPIQGGIVPNNSGQSGVIRRKYNPATGMIE